MPLKDDRTMSPSIARPIEKPRQPGQPWSFLDAAAFLGVSPKTLERAEIAGRITAIRFGRRKSLADSLVRTLAETGFPAARAVRLDPSVER